MIYLNLPKYTVGRKKITVQHEVWVFCFHAFLLSKGHSRYYASLMSTYAFYTDIIDLLDLFCDLYCMGVGYSEFSFPSIVEHVRCPTLGWIVMYGVHKQQMIPYCIILNVQQPNVFCLYGVSQSNEYTPLACVHRGYWIIPISDCLAWYRPYFCQKKVIFTAK